MIDLAQDDSDLSVVIAVLRAATFDHFLESRVDDSPEADQLKRWVRAFRVDISQIMAWLENPHAAGSANLAMFLLGCAATREEVIALFDSVVMNQAHPRIPQALLEHFDICHDCRTGTAFELRPFFLS